MRKIMSIEVPNWPGLRVHLVGGEGSGASVKEYTLSKGAEALSYMILALALVGLILWRASLLRTLRAYSKKRDD